MYLELNQSVDSRFRGNDGLENLGMAVRELRDDMLGIRK